MDILSRSGDSVKRLWAGLNGPQRFVLVLSAALMAVLLLWGSGTAAADSWRKVAGQEIGQAERADLLKTLAQKKIVHEVRGGEIYVRKDQAEKVVLELAGEGLSSKVMEELLKSSNVFDTRWDKEKRYQVALQRKLEYMVRQVDNVRNASVQITPASDAQQIGFQGPKASASVQIELKPGTALSTGNVKAIAGVVSHAVSGLDSDRVHIMDTQGRSYRLPKAEDFGGLAETLRDAEFRIESEIKVKLAELLPPGSGIAVRAFARSKGERVEQLQHPRTVLTKESVRSVSKTSGAPSTGGVLKGVDAVSPDTGPDHRTVEKEDQAEYKPEEKRTWTYDPAGVIERVTVGILLPTPVDAQGKPIGKTPPMEAIHKLAMMASGAKAEDLTVVALETRAPEPFAAPQPAELAFDWFFANWTKIALAFLALFALIVVAIAIRGALPRGEVEEIKAIASRLGEPLQAAALADPLRPAPEGDVLALRRGIQEAVDRDPEEAAAALKTWVAGR